MWPKRSTLEIGGQRLGVGHPLFVVAEIGLNHGGSVDRALALVDAAAEAGADAVKLQTVVATDLVAPSCPAPAHVRAASLADFFASFELDEAAHTEIAARVRAHGLKLLATPLSLAVLPMLRRLDLDAYKIASGDLTWHQLIAACAATGRPLVLSTGLASIQDIADALDVAQTGGSSGVALLHCVSAYPVPRGSENLQAVATLARRFAVPVGLSDHAEDAFAVPMAVALGGALYERHIVLDDDQAAVDREVSSTPAEFAAAVRAARRAHAALGHGRKECLAAEAVNRTASRRSLCAARDLAAGHLLSEADLVALRPASGLPPPDLPLLVGAQLPRAYRRGEPIAREDVRSALGRVHAS